jgi:cell shape-determining protein MreD
MSFLIAAVGAVLASLLETSVLPELKIGLNLVLTFALVSGMLLSVEEGLLWAFLGGISLDILTPGGHPLGTTALCLLLALGGGLLISRLAQPPRVLTVVVSVFCLTFLFEALLTVVLAATVGTRVAGFSFAATLVTAILNAIVAAIAGRTIRLLSTRFSPAEHMLR